MFAKLYEAEDVGQILIKLGSDEQNVPEVRGYVEPEGLGVCSLAVGWENDSQRDWEKAHKFFDTFDEEQARQFVQPILDMVEES